MKKIALFAAMSLLAAQQAFAVYFVVLKDGTKYRARDRWTVVSGKALITLENGQQLQIDPSLIDTAKTDQQNKSGLGDATLLASGQPTAGNSKAPESSSLGSMARLRKIETNNRSSAAAPGGSGINSLISPDVLARFTSVYENVGIYGAKATVAGPATVRVELVADSEDQVFKAISATAYLIARLPAVTQTNIDNVELFMTTIKSEPAGKFNMTAAEAKQLDSRVLSLQKYFVDRVIF